MRIVMWAKSSRIQLCMKTAVHVPMLITNGTSLPLFVPPFTFFRFLTLFHRNLQ